MSIIRREGDGFMEQVSEPRTMASIFSPQHVKLIRD